MIEEKKTTPTKYHKKKTIDLKMIETLYSLSLTDDEVSKVLDISETSLKNWKADPEFSEAIARGKKNPYLAVSKRIRIPKPVKRGANNPKGRPQVYQEEIGAYICSELMLGRTLTKISQEDGMPSLPTIYSWLNFSHPNYKPNFFKSYTEARRVQAEVMADQTADISDEVGDPQRNKLRVETRRWLAKCLLPTKFSDKVQLTGAEGKDLIPAVPTKVVFNFVGEEEEKE
jgi:hypothetical protein